MRLFKSGSDKDILAVGCMRSSKIAGFYDKKSRKQLSIRERKRRAWLLRIERRDCGYDTGPNIFSLCCFKLPLPSDTMHISFSMVSVNIILFNIILFCAAVKQLRSSRGGRTALICDLLLGGSLVKRLGLSGTRS